MTLRWAGSPLWRRKEPNDAKRLLDDEQAYVLMGGMTLPMIGKLLGYTQVQTTQRYAYLLDDPLARGLNRWAICCTRSRGWFKMPVPDPNCS